MTVDFFLWKNPIRDIVVFLVLFVGCSKIKIGGNGKVQGILSEILGSLFEGNSI